MHGVTGWTFVCLLEEVTILQYIVYSEIQEHKTEINLQAALSVFNNKAAKIQEQHKAFNLFNHKAGEIQEHKAAYI